MAGVGSIDSLIRRYGDIEYFAGCMVQAMSDGREDIAEEMLGYIESGLYRMDKEFLRREREVLDRIGDAIKMGRDNEVDLYTDKFLKDLYTYIVGVLERMGFAGR